MARVCLLGDSEVALRQTLLSHETARHALNTYELDEPFHNAVGLETVSLGAAVSLLNDLNWYLIRYVDSAMIREESISDSEWLSRDLATKIRDEEIEADDSGRYLKIYGLEQAESDEEAITADEESGPSWTESDTTPDPSTETSSGPPRLVEPMYVTRSEGTRPTYDLRDTEETVVVRVSESEFRE